MKKVISCVLAILMLLSSFTALTGCQKDNETEKDGMGYILSQDLTWTSEGKYSGEISLDGEADIILKDFSSDDFEMTAGKLSEDEDYFVLNNFNVTKKDDKTLSYEFSTPVGNDLDFVYTMISKNAITSDNRQVGVILQIVKPDIYLTGDYTGAYYGSDTITLNLEFGDQGKFSDSLIPAMFVLPAGIDADVAVERLSDTQAKVTISGMPEHINTSYINIKVLDEAINSPFAEDIVLNVLYVNSFVSVDQDSISFDASEKIMTIGKIMLADGMKGVAGGLSVDTLFANIVEQSYSEEGNYYSLKVKAKEKFDVEDISQVLNITAKIEFGADSIEYIFNPFYAETYLKSEYHCDGDSKTVTVTVSVNNGSFVPGMTSADFAITGTDQYTDFKLESINEKEAVFEAHYIDEENAEGYLSIFVPGDKVASIFTNDYYEVSVFVAVPCEDRNIDWSGLGKLGVAIGAEKLKKVIGSELTSALLPYAYEFLGIKKESDSKKIIAQIKNLSGAIDGVSHQLDVLSSVITDTEYKSKLNTFQSLQNNLLVDGMSLVANEDIYMYYEKCKEWQDGRDDFDAFYEKVQKQLEGGFFNFYEWSMIGCFITYDNYIGLCTQTREKWIEEYNLYVTTIKEKNWDVSEFTSWFKERPIIATWGAASPYRGEELYAYCKDKKTYTNDYTVFETPEDNQKFVDAVNHEVGIVAPGGGANIKNYLKDIFNLGSGILGTSAGISVGYGRSFFSVLDNMYNFGSQTYEAKRAFLTKLQSVYLTNALVVLQYCYLTNDVLTFSLANQIEDVVQELESLWTDVDALKALADAGNDKILINGAIISKRMISVKINGYTDFFNFLGNNAGIALGALTISTTELEDLMKRAQKRGLTLAQDLKNAGFSDVSCNNSDPNSTSCTEYVYLTGAVKDTVRRSVCDGRIVLNAFAQVFANKRTRDYWYIFFKTLVIQKSPTNRTIRKDAELARMTHYDNSKPSNRYEFGHSYDYVIAFRAVK